MLEAAGLDLDSSTWSMFLTRSGTPKDIVDRISMETKRAVNATEIKARFEQLGIDPFGNTPEEANTFLNSEVAKMSAIIQSKNIKPE
jgi:tripartite-type tricarboxylate transporter receptor subunit TctC